MWYNYGNKLQFEIYGASHEPCIGIRMKGLPAGESIDLGVLHAFMRRRAPGQADFASGRSEPDVPELMAGLENGKTTGEELHIRIKNTDARSRDYDTLRYIPRPGHADYAVWLKSGGAEDMRGGGRFSGRMTAPLCAAGGVCLQILQRRGVDICAHIASVGDSFDEAFDPMGEAPEAFDRIRRARFPTKNAEAGERMREAILAASHRGDSLGGVVECMVTGFPAGCGDALMEGIESSIAAMLFGIPAVKGVEFGAGFHAAKMLGSENNDTYRIVDGKPVPVTNNAGGILGGISTGLPIVFRAAFKPVPSIARPQLSVNLFTLEETELSVPGRHDACIAPRAVPVVEAAAAIALLDIMERTNE